MADYSAALLAALCRVMEVRIEPRTADVRLYHLGNNQLHAEAYRRALAEPGVVVLHDAVLHHFALGFFTEQQYVDEFAYNYGDWARGLARDLWVERSRSAADSKYFRYPMLKRVAERARAVIVHNAAAARTVHQHCPGARVFEIPHLLLRGPKVHTADVLAARQRLGVRPTDLLCGVFGFLRPSKRISTVLRACERVGLHLLLAGECPADLQRALTDVGRKSLTRRVPYTDAVEFETLARATDVCINLRFPTAGETSGIAIRFMGLAKTVLMTDSQEIASYPQSACLRILPGLAEAEHLATVLTWLREFQSAAREIGAEARRWVERHCDPHQVAEAYAAVLRDA